MFLLLLKFSGGSGLQPHRLERHIRSTDPDFETKVARSPIHWALP